MKTFSGGYELWKYLFKVILFFTIIFNTCCTHLKIHDLYYIDYGGEFGGEGYYLECNPGYFTPIIENIQSVEWNKQIIIVEQKPSEGTENVWYIVKAKGKELVCGNDTTIGSLTKKEKNEYLKTVKTGRLKKKKVQLLINY
jgi:hypothetical protein